MQSDADTAGFFSPSPGGPIRTGRGLYRCVAIVTLVMMIMGSFAFLPSAARAASTEASAELAPNARIVDSGVQLMIGATGNGTVNAQTGPSLVDLLIAVLLDLVATAQDGDSASAPPASNEGGIVGIIYAAADAYGQPREDMLRVARCESNLNPNAVNAGSQASGLFQFLPSTWATTPYADEDIFDPVASANAAAWMWDNGRRNEWVCQ